MRNRGFAPAARRGIPAPLTLFLMDAASRPLIFIVEDDCKIADMVANYLEAQGFATRTVGDGQVALEALCQAPPATFPALVLLDLMLPGQGGMAVCQAVRRFSAVPIIMLTARVDEIDRLEGLDNGADDYLCKPFSLRELVARIKALLRRSAGPLAPHNFAPLPRAHLYSRTQPVPPEFTIDEAGLCAHWQGQPLHLTPVEFRMLRLLLSRPGQVFARARLLDAIHADYRDVSDRAIDSHVKNLRRKIELLRPQGSGIVSVYGAGYRFDRRPDVTA